MTPAAWASARAPAICRAIRTARSGRIGAGAPSASTSAASSRSSERPSTYSMTRNGRPSSVVPVANAETRLGCDSRATARASRCMRATMSGSSSSSACDLHRRSAPSAAAAR
jgi:hypothetical protein